MTDERVQADFVNDLKHELGRKLRSAGYGVDLAKLSAFEVTVRYFATLRRRISPSPRNVRRAKSFAAILHLSPEHVGGLALIERKAEAGADLTPHQSTRVMDAEFDDRLLNDWGIHHFHLGTLPYSKDPRFMDRTGPVLYARVTDTTFDMIDVRGHGTWHQQELIRIVHESWPESLEQHRVDPSVLSADSHTDATVKTLRRAGLSYLLTMPDGTIYWAPGGGYQSSCVSTRAVTTADRWLDCAHDREQHVREGFADFCARAKAAGHKVDRPARVHLRLDDAGWYAEDAATGFRVEILRYPTAS